MLVNVISWYWLIDHIYTLSLRIATVINMGFESWPSKAWLMILIDTPMSFWLWAVACINQLSSAISSTHRFPPHRSIQPFFKQLQIIISNWSCQESNPGLQRRRWMAYQCIIMPQCVFSLNWCLKQDCSFILSTSSVEIWLKMRFEGKLLNAIFLELLLCLSDHNGKAPTCHNLQYCIDQ